MEVRSRGEAQEGEKFRVFPVRKQLCEEDGVKGSPVGRRLPVIFPIQLLLTALSLLFSPLMTVEGKRRYERARGFDV